MAFVFEAERTNAVPNKNSLPGPGQYIAHQDYKVNRGYAPFLSTTQRGIGKKITKQSLPGPGSYDPVLNISNSLKPSPAFHSTLVPEKEIVETSNNLTNVFKSKTKRFEYKIDTELPGPGKYYNDKGIGKPLSTTALGSKSLSTFPIQKLTKENRTVVPSIPSYTHSYGYSESDNQKLTLNENPLIEIQQFVGPGYYDTKDEFQTTNKGTTWHKSGSKRFEAFEKKLATAHVGPGTYEAVTKEGALPLYKGKPSSGFASATGRITFGKDKSKTTMKFYNSQTADNTNFAIGIETPYNGIHEQIREEVNLEDGIPGPGHYHSEGITSSLKMKYKPAKFQFFGSGSSRFDDPANGLLLGPGEYNLPGNTSKNKSKIKVPFQSTEEKLKGMPSSALGPGVYDTKTTIVDRVQDKAKKGYLGSFGSTEIRFKAEKIPEALPEKVKFFENTVPVTRSNMEDTEKKPSHFFAPNKNKPVIEKEEIPPPGAYDVHYYDLAKKVSQTESSFFNAKKVPFKSSEPRFKENKNKGGQKEENVDEFLIKKRQTVMKSGVYPQPHSMFASKSTRSVSTLSKTGGGSSGVFYNLQDQWIKKTYNIKYLDDNHKQAL